MSIVDIIILDREVVVKKTVIGIFSSILVTPNVVYALTLKDIEGLKKEILLPNEEIKIVLNGNEQIIRYSDVINSIGEEIEEGVALEIVIHEESATIDVNIDDYLRNLPILEGSHNPPNFITSR